MPGIVPSGTDNPLIRGAAATGLEEGEAQAGNPVAEENRDRPQQGPAEPGHPEAGGYQGSYAQPAKDPSLKAPAAQPTPWEDLANQLVASYAGQIAALTPVANGTTAAGADATMSANAESMLGASANSPMAAWLNANTAAAQSQSQATQAASTAEEQAQQAGSAGIQKALVNLGTAEQEQMNAAPYQQLLSSLAADVPYKLLGGETLPQVRSDINTAVADIGLNPKASTTPTISGLPAPNVAAGTPNPFSTTLNTTTPNPAPQG